MANGYEFVALASINPCQRPHLYELYPLSMQYPCDFVDRRAGCDNVVDDGDVAILAGVVGESLANVLLALVGAQARLLGVAAVVSARWRSTGISRSRDQMRAISSAWL